MTPSSLWDETIRFKSNGSHPIHRVLGSVPITSCVRNDDGTLSAKIDSSRLSSLTKEKLQGLYDLFNDPVAALNIAKAFKYI